MVRIVLNATDRATMLKRANTAIISHGLSYFSMCEAISLKLSKNIFGGEYQLILLIIFLLQLCTNPYKHRTSTISSAIYQFHLRYPDTIKQVASCPTNHYLWQFCDKYIPRDINWCTFLSNVFGNILKRNANEAKPSSAYNIDFLPMQIIKFTLVSWGVGRHYPKPSHAIQFARNANNHIFHHWVTQGNAKNAIYTILLAIDPKVRKVKRQKQDSDTPLRMFLGYDITPQLRNVLSFLKNPAVPQALNLIQ